MARAAQRGNWIADAVKRPGALTAKAARSGQTPLAYAEAHRDDPGRTGQQARLALTLQAIRRPKPTKARNAAAAGNT